MDRPRQIFFLAPVSDDVGPTSMALGLVQALRRDHVAVGFVEPILHPASRGAADLATHFARTILHLDAPEPIGYADAETAVRGGGLDTLMEGLVATAEAAGAGCDALVIQGLIPFADLQIAAKLNAAMVQSFAASLVPVLSGAGQTAQTLAGIVDLTIRQFADNEEPPPVAGVLVNRVKPAPLTGALGKFLMCAAGPVPLLADVPFEPRLSAPRLSDVVEALNLGIEQAGNLPHARVQNLVTAGRGVEGVIDRLLPGSLVVAAGERSDIVLATALAYMQGIQIAGLLLTCGTRLSPQIAAMLRAPMLAGLPILTTTQDTFATDTALAGLSRHVRRDDTERMTQAIAHAEAHIDTAALRTQLRHAGPVRMPPAAFRHRMVQAARAASRRIVLPEGTEPRTVQAAAICQRKGIATCVLLGDPARVGDVARAYGVVLPAGLEIVDPAAVRGAYALPMTELRRAKGLTEAQARQQLEDNVVLGTMMLAAGEVDGLVSGAEHTTANTIRPALQLIRTAPGVSVVSSVFFMLMPNEVLVYGDCAVNPDPSAEELADIAIQSADSAASFGIDPLVAMISYSTGSSGGGAGVEKVRRALDLARAKRPELLIDGPMQYDAASVASVGLQKAPASPVAGRANVFIFPDLNTGNTTYKAVQRSAHVVSIGPMLLGLRKPVNDLSRGALVDDIVYTIALTAVQAQQAASTQNGGVRPFSRASQQDALPNAAE